MKRYCILSLLTVLSAQYVMAQPYSVNINTVAIPPVNPVISQYVSSGSVSSSLTFGAVGTPPIQVYVQGKIECLSPSPFTISVNPNFTQAGTITLTPGVPTQLPATQLTGAFGFFNDNNLVASGVNLASLKDANNNIKLPAGVYRICFVAKQMDPASGQPGANLSNPNLGCGSFTIQNTQPTNGVTITTIVIPPLNPAISQAVFTGSIKPALLFNGTGGNAQVKVFGKIECIAPSPFTISLNQNYSQQQAITLTTGLPLQLTPGQVADAFGNFTDNNLTITGINIALLKDANNNFKLPDGTYRICFYARYVDPATGAVGNNASDPNLGCGTFNLCNKAAAPQFTQPVNNLNISNSVPVIQSASPVVFTWIPPNAICGAHLDIINYDFEIRELLPSQTITDAINNPPVFIKTQLPSSTFLLDTILYKNILQQGKQYVIRVKANTLPNAPVQIDNNGYSRVETFQYGQGAQLNNNNPLPPSNNNQAPPPNNNPPNNLPPGTCVGVVAPSNTTAFSGKDDDLKNVDLVIGKFKLHTNTIQKNGNVYKGDGYIMWKPFAIDLRLRVKFDNIKVNTDKVVYDGIVNTTTEAGNYTWSPLATANDITKALGVASEKSQEDLNNYVNKPAKLINQLLGNADIDMPLGLNTDIGGTPLIVAMMGVSFSATGTNMNLLTTFNVPESNGWYSLAGTNFCIDPTGIVISNGTLYLPNDRDFNIGSGKDNWNIKLKGCTASDTAKGTYLNIKNNKFEMVMARAELALPQNALVAEDKDAKILPGSLITKLQFRFADWNDWMASVEIPNFQITDVKGLSFKPNTVYYDHSVKGNAPGFQYPKNVINAPASFEGLYIKQLDVLLPPDFKTFNSKPGERTSFSATDLIVSSEGVSAYIQGKNVIDISTGNLGGWGFSLNNIEVDILKSTFQSGKMDGKILLPISTTQLDYSGDLHIEKDSLSYAFVIKPSATMSFDIWKASVNLNPNSYVEVKRDSLGAAVTALLNGVISIDISNGAPAIKFDAISFDSLGISNRNIVTKKKEFWMSAGTWKFASPQKSVAGFPASLGDITPYISIKSEIEIGLKFKLSLGIGGKDKTIVGAEAKLALYGAVKFGMDDFRPNFTVTASVRADSVRLFGDVGPVKVDGWLAFYKKDNVYGDGLKGHVEATFPMVKVEATAQFGSVNNYNYWYIDACAQFPTPIPVIGPIGINGFGGGAYYNMMLQNGPPQDNEMKAKNVANNNTPGTSMSGIQFVPNAGSFGLRATVLVAMVTGAGPKAMNAKITMGAELNNGAFQKLTLTGDVYVFTNPPKNDQAVVTGHVDIIYDIPAEKFSLDALIVAKFAVAKLTVPINLYTGPDGWFFKVGDPWGQKVTIDFPKVETAFYHYNIGASAYFVVGSLVNPQLPPLPAEITTKMGITSDPGIQSFLSQLNNTPGSGMMFGAEVHASLGFNAAILYADANAIIGFDMMLKHFDNLTCNGGNSAGWENWYATGQLYAYLDLDVGLQVDVWFYTGKLSLVKFAAGAVLQAGLPNPTWMEGNVFVQGEVLDGLIKVSTNAHMALGEKCYPDPDPLRDIKIISDYGPKGNKESVFLYPYAASNVALDKYYEISVPPTSDKPQGEIRIYRFEVESFRLLKNGTPVESTGLEYQNDNNTVILKRNKILDGNTDYTGEINCYAQQYYEGEGWSDPYNDKDKARKAIKETSTFNFKTGPKPDFIADENIAFSYPVNTQRYVLKQAFNSKAKIHLDQAQDNILNGDGKGYTALKSYKLFLIPVGSTDTVKTDFTWDDNTLDLTYNLPTALKNNTTYKAEFWSFEKSGSMVQSSVLTQLKTQSSMSSQNIKGINFQQKETKVVSAAIKIQKPIYTMYFRTSQFNTLSEKINAMGNWSASNKNNIFNISNDAMATEHFDDFETKGFTAPNGQNSYPPLLNVNIPWDNSKQNDRFASDNIYGNTIFLHTKFVHLDFGINWLRDYLTGQPLNAIDISKLSSDKPLSPSESGIPAPPSNSNAKVSSGMGFAMKLPMSNANKNVSQTFSFGYQFIGWNREQYFKADYQLMKDFANAVTWNATAFYGWSAQKTQAVLSNMDGDISFAYSGLGGYVGMPWNKFYYLFGDPFSMNIINKLRTLQFTDYPKGNRTIQFGYKAGNMQGTQINKTFTY
jgi:hypothetical protein